jgi:hypothetical protein
MVSGFALKERQHLSQIHTGRRPAGRSAARTTAGDELVSEVAEAIADELGAE